MTKPVNDKHFQLLTKQIQDLIASYELDQDADFTETQKKQVEDLIKAERVFRKLLINDSRGHLVYKAFIKYITEERRNILAARPYFRERQEIFSAEVSPAIKSLKHKKLYKFDINYTFILFALSVVNWGPNSKITKSAEVVNKARTTLVELNTPLSISRARIFRDKVPESHLSYMDLIQICFEASINAIDKYVLPYSPVFRSVIIGRCVGDLISQFSDTMIHFYPSDRRKIYRANKARGRNTGELDYKRIAKEVNNGPPLESLTNPAEIQQLLTAVSYLSLDSTPPDPGMGAEPSDTLMDVYVAEDEYRPDNRFEDKQINQMLYNGFDHLGIKERKLLQLKGCFVK